MWIVKIPKPIRNEANAHRFVGPFTLSIHADEWIKKTFPNYEQYTFTVYRMEGPDVLR